MPWFMPQVDAQNTAKVVVVTTWGGDVWGVRRELLPWMQVLMELGVCHFYVRPDHFVWYMICMIARLLRADLH